MNAFSDEDVGDSLKFSQSLCESCGLAWRLGRCVGKVVQTRVGTPGAQRRIGALKWMQVYSVVLT